jgi:hypothetical protein
MLAVAVGLAFSLVATFYWTRPRRRHKREPPLLVVDCGSGATRAKVFFRDKQNRIRQQHPHEYAKLSQPWRQPPIVQVLETGNMELWASSIQTLIEATGSRAAIVGATGGLRAAEASGAVTPAKLAELRRCLARVAPTAEFRALSGEDEARAELAAVQHVADRSVPSSAVRPLGMISGGGMTSQVGYDERGVAGVLSIVVDLNGHSKTMLSASTTSESERAQLVAAYEAHLEKAISASGRQGTLHGT